MSEQKTILYDGKNMSLTAGTGIATYARNLIGAANELGHRSHVLYGENAGFHHDPLLREIEFFDHHPRLRRRTKFREYPSLSLRSLLPPRPYEINAGDNVIRRNFESKMPNVAGLWNSRLLYDYCDTTYRLFGRFITLKNPMAADVAHWTYPVPLRLKGARNIYTIHDLVPLKLPFTTLDRKRQFYRMIRQICASADLVVTISEQSKRDIHSLFKIADEKVVNTYQAVTIPQKYLNAPEDTVRTALKGLHDLDYKNYILFYGAIEPKKNVGRLIEAYLASGLDMPLVIVGKDGWLVDDELALLETPVAKGRVVRINHVRFPDLVNLIRGARMLAFPSLYEGFGLPIVEGMMCNTPVLTSNLGSTAEIAGGAALLVDPYDIGDIRDGLIKLARDDDFCADLVRRGSRRTNEFTPDAHKKRLQRLVYDDCAGRAPAADVRHLSGQAHETEYFHNNYTN